MIFFDEPGTCLVSVNGRARCTLKSVLTSLGSRFAAYVVRNKPSALEEARPSGGWFFNLEALEFVTATTQNMKDIAQWVFGGHHLSALPLEVKLRTSLTKCLEELGFESVPSRGALRLEPLERVFSKSEGPVFLLFWIAPVVELTYHLKSVNKVQEVCAESFGRSFA